MYTVLTRIILRLVQIFLITMVVLSLVLPAYAAPIKQELTPIPTQESPLEPTDVVPLSASDTNSEIMPTAVPATPTSVGDMELIPTSTPEMVSPTPVPTATSLGNQNGEAAYDPAKDVNAKIVGGTIAAAGEFPWQIALIPHSAKEPTDPTNQDGFFQAQYCAGTLIDPQWVVTAAHCAYGATVAQIDIVAGIYNLKYPDVGYQRRSLNAIIVHPAYSPRGHDNDIALLRLSSPVTLGGSGATAVQTIPLVSVSTSDLAGFTATVAGWGNRNSNNFNNFPNELYKVDLPIMKNIVCGDPGVYGSTITANMMCAGYLSGGKDSCQGDSGGPLMVTYGSPSVKRLAGIVSWGNGCAQKNAPGVYTRVSKYTNWVNAYYLAPPPATMLVSPSGTLTMKTPTFRWNAVTGSTVYTLQIKNALSVTVFEKLYSASQVFCPTGSGQCYMTVTLPLGTYTWSVRTQNGYSGVGPWSTTKTLTLATLGRATLLYPKATVYTPRPVFRWSAVPYATGYTLTINNTTSRLTLQRYSLSQASCTATACWVSSPIVLPVGNYTWYIQAYNSYSTGSWSPVANFYVRSYGVKSKNASSWSVVTSHQ